MRIALGSIFRDSRGYLDRYFAQASGLRELLQTRDPESELRLVLVEGDSRDGTLEAIEKRAARDGFDLRLRKVDHGGPRWGSIDKPERWRALALCCNAVLEQIDERDEALIYVESDLAWQPETMVALIGRLSEYPAVAPMCFTGPQGLAGPRGFFYDIWGHIKDGVNFTSHPPFHPSLQSANGRLVEIDSAGSCVVTGPAILSDVRTGLIRFNDGADGSPPDCIRGYCRAINACQSGIHGHGLYLDTTLEVRHL